MRTLFLQAPTFDGFDGGAGSRYQAKREIKSFWYPTWLAQPAALVPNSKLIDAPPHDIKLPEIVAQANDFDLVVPLDRFDDGMRLVADWLHIEKQVNWQPNHAYSEGHVPWAARSPNARHTRDSTFNLFLNENYDIWHVRRIVNAIKETETEMREDLRATPRK